MLKPTTLKEIASRVGVGSSAVSAVLRSNPSRYVRVSDETRERILQAARELNYRPNRAAQSLRSRTANVIGAYAAAGYLEPNVPFAFQVVAGLHRCCQNHRKNLLLMGPEVDETSEDLYNRLVSGQIDGCVTLTSGDNPIVQLLSESQLPVVAIVNGAAKLPSVVADELHGGELIAEYLAAKGHRRVCYIGTTRILVSANRRYDAFRTAADARGIEIAFVSEESTAGRSKEVWRAWKESSPSTRPTAAICWNDIAAYDLLEHGRAQGLRSPEDMAVVGFDGVELAYPAPWKLTTVRAPWMKVAEVGIDLLTDKLNGLLIPMETTLPVELVVGETA